MSSAVTNAEASTAHAASVRGKTIYFIELYTTPFYTNAVEGMKKVAKRLGIKLDILNSNGDAGTESANVTDAISAGAAAVVLDPVGAVPAVTDLARLRKAGIPTFCLDSCATLSYSEKNSVGWAQNLPSVLGADVGTAAASYIRSRMDGKATIAEVDCNSLGPACSDRYLGIKQEIAKVPGAKIVAYENAYETAPAESDVVDMLTANPKINMVITNNQGGTEGAVAAVRQMHLEGKVIVFGIDMDAVIAQELLAKPVVLMYTVGQDSYQEGADAIKNLAEHIEGKSLPFTHEIISPVQYPRSAVGLIKTEIRTGIIAAS